MQKIYHGYKKTKAKAIYFDGKNVQEVIEFGQGNIKIDKTGRLVYNDPIPDYDSFNVSFIPSNIYIVIIDDDDDDYGYSQIRIVTDSQFSEMFVVEGDG